MKDYKSGRIDWFIGYCLMAFRYSVKEGNPSNFAKDTKTKPPRNKNEESKRKGQKKNAISPYTKAWANHEIIKTKYFNGLDDYAQKAKNQNLIYRKKKIHLAASKERAKPPLFECDRILRAGRVSGPYTCFFILLIPSKANDKAYP